MFLISLEGNIFNPIVTENRIQTHKAEVHRAKAFHIELSRQAWLILLNLTFLFINSLTIIHVNILQLNMVPMSQMFLVQQFHIWKYNHLYTSIHTLIARSICQEAEPIKYIDLWVTDDHKMKFYPGLILIYISNIADYARRTIYWLTIWLYWPLCRLLEQCIKRKSHVLRWEHNSSASLFDDKCSSWKSSCKGCSLLLCILKYINKYTCQMHRIISVKIIPVLRNLKSF